MPRCSRTIVVLPILRGFATPIERARRECDPAYPVHGAEGQALRIDRGAKRVPAWTGRSAGRRRASTAAPNARSRRCSRKRSRYLTRIAAGAASATSRKKPAPCTTTRTVQVNDSWYAARPARIGSEVIVRIFERELEIRDMTTLALMRRHPRATERAKSSCPMRSASSTPRARPDRSSSSREYRPQCPRSVPAVVRQTRSGGAKKHVGHRRLCRAIRPASSSRPPRWRSRGRSAPRRPCGSSPSSCSHRRSYASSADTAPRRSPSSTSSSASRTEYAEFFRHAQRCAQPLIPTPNR